MSPASVVNVVRRARSAGLSTYAEVVALDEADLEVPVSARAPLGSSTSKKPAVVRVTMPSSG